jgi:hypothetical protein
MDCALGILFFLWIFQSFPGINLFKKVLRKRFGDAVFLMCECVFGWLLLTRLG